MQHSFTQKEPEKYMPAVHMLCSGNFDDSSLGLIIVLTLGWSIMEIRESWKYVKVTEKRNCIRILNTIDMDLWALIVLLVGSPPAVQRLSGGLFQEVIITNTIPVKEQNYFPELTVLSVANLVGETIWRIYDDCSVSSIFPSHAWLFRLLSSMWPL